MATGRYDHLTYSLREVAAHAVLVCSTRKPVTAGGSLDTVPVPALAACVYLLYRQTRLHPDRFNHSQRRTVALLATMLGCDVQCNRKGTR